MNMIAGRTAAAVASVALLMSGQAVRADAQRWAGGMPGGADVVLAMRSIDEAEASLRALARSAQVDWLPTAGRLLAATNLSPGTDTKRPLAVGFSLERDGETAHVRFVAVIPAERPGALAANFEAVPSNEHAGLFAFDFAQRNYFARVLDDGHLAISGSADLLLGLRESDAMDLDSPIRVTLGPGAASTLMALARSIGPDEESSLGDVPELPEGVETLALDVTPSAESLVLRARVTARAGSELASRWTASDAAPLGPVPFPSADYMLIAQGTTGDAAVRDWLLNLTSGVSGVEDDALAGASSVALMVQTPPTLMDWAKIVASAALTSDDADALRDRIGAALAGLPGASVSMNANTRVGVAIDRFRLPPMSADQGADPASSGVGGLFGRREQSRQQQTIEGRMFVRNGRVYLTTAGEGPELDRLIAFGERSESIDSREELSRWLALLPADAAGRGALNIRPLAGIFAMAASAHGNRIDLTEEIAPVVGSMRTLDGSVQATVIFPSEVVRVLEQVRRFTGQMRERE